MQAALERWGNTPLALIVVALLAGPSCSKTPEPEATAATPRPASSAVAETKTAASKPQAPSGPTDVAWDAPPGWQKADNPSPMRKATYKIPKVKDDTEDAELSVSQAGGTVDMNIQRWSGQFSQATPDVKRTERRVGDLKVTIVEIRGAFTGSGMPGAPPSPPKPKFALLGAIVETATPTFFKMTGPEKTVAAAKTDFEKLIDSLRAK